jgi:radical SAM protein with 4Fe4S-binding SPASM domain
MPSPYVSFSPWMRFPLWERMLEGRRLYSFELEITARCNHNCRHCYIALPADDSAAKARELSSAEICGIADEAAAMGALWCFITGGEPLLRKDFIDIYLSLKRKGLLITVFTNATLVAREHVRLFQRYPPRDIEVTVYGITRETYERVTRRPGSFEAFHRGLNLLLQNGITVRLKTMALRSNVHELPGIASFCRKHTKDYFRYDPSLHLRYDGDSIRNAEIRSERLSPAEISALEWSDPDRAEFLRKACNRFMGPEPARDGRLFCCGVGSGTFSLSCEGVLHLCPSLRHPDCVHDLRKGTLADGLRRLVPRVLGMRSNRPLFIEKCRSCPLTGICQWCPAVAYLETGDLDVPVDYSCEVTHERARHMLAHRGGKQDRERSKEK